MKSTARFIPESVTITRRPEGGWDMVALVGFPTGIAQVSVILDDASFEVEASFLQSRSVCPCELCSYIPCKLTGYELAMKTALRPGVDGRDGIFIRQEIIEGGCDAAE